MHITKEKLLADIISLEQQRTTNINNVNNALGGAIQYAQGLIKELEEKEKIEKEKNKKSAKALTIKQ